MSKQTEVKNLLNNLGDNDVANATQACRELQELLRDDSYSGLHDEIQEALDDAYEAWGDENCNNWSSD